MKLSSRPSALELQRALETAIAMVQSGRAGPAARLLKDIAAHRPNDFDVLHLLGAARVMDGRLEDGISHLRGAAAIKPGAAAVWINLGSALERAGRPAEAAEAYARGLAANPDLAEANHRLCLALLAAGQTDKAASCAETYLGNHTANDTAHVTLGLVRLQQGRPEEAAENLRSAVTIRPANMLATANLAYVLGSLYRYAEAIPLLSTVVARQPKDWAALEKLVHARRSLCDWSGIEVLETRLIEAAIPERANIDPWTLFGLTDRAEILRRAAITRTEAMVGTPPPAMRPSRPYAHERIRIGYLAGDFRDHPVAHVTAALIEAHDRRRFEVFAISYGPDDSSAVRSRISAGCDRFEDVAGLDAKAIATRVRELEIDIAVDLSGPTEYGLPHVLSHRPAPVQVSFLGYPGTTGAPWVDYLIADPIIIPAGHERYYTEHVVRLPGCYFPPSHRSISVERPTRASCGLPESGFVFASFNNSYKISSSSFDTWMRILSRVPDSVLWLRAAGEAAESNLRAAAAGRNIAPHRLVFAPRLPHDGDHLARLTLADLFLDSSPYNAHTTASDALWAGLPVLTTPGQSFASRVASSLVSSAGLPELSVPDLPAYETMAIDLARQPERLSALKSHLAASRSHCRLFDLNHYRCSLESAYFTMHERARKGLKHGPMNVGGV